MGSVKALARLFGKATGCTKKFAKAAITPHTAQVRFFKKAGNLKGGTLALAYGAATLATPAYLTLLAKNTEGDNSGAKKAAKDSLVGGLLFGPAGSAIIGLLSLDNETNKIKQRLDEQEDDNYFEYMYNNDEDFRNEYNRQRMEMEEDPQYDDFA